MKADERRTRAGKRLSVQRWMNLPGAHTKPQSRSRGKKEGRSGNVGNTNNYDNDEEM